MKTTLKKKLKRPVEVIVYVLQTFLYKSLKKKNRKNSIAQNILMH